MQVTGDWQLAAGRCPSVCPGARARCPGSTSLPEVVPRLGEADRGDRFGYRRMPSLPMMVR